MVAFFYLESKSNTGIFVFSRACSGEPLRNNKSVRVFSGVSGCRCPTLFLMKTMENSSRLLSLTWQKAAFFRRNVFNSTFPPPYLGGQQAKNADKIIKEVPFEQLEPFHTQKGVQVKTQKGQLGVRSSCGAGLHVYAGLRLFSDSWVTHLGSCCFNCGVANLLHVTDPYRHSQNIITEGKKIRSQAMEQKFKS